MPGIFIITECIRVVECTQTDSTTDLGKSNLCITGVALVIHHQYDADTCVIIRCSMRLM